MLATSCKNSLVGHFFKSTITNSIFIQYGQFSGVMPVLLNNLLNLQKAGFYTVDTPIASKQ